MAYVDLDYIRDHGTMDPESVDAFEASSPGVIDKLAESVSKIFDAKLRKRYAAPFKEPYPEALRYHVAQFVCFQIWIRRGFNPGSEQDALLTRMRDEAYEWLQEAADSKDGLIELPLRETDPPEGKAIVRSGPIGRSDASPYEWTDRQRARIRGGR